MERSFYDCSLKVGRCQPMKNVKRFSLCYQFIVQLCIVTLNEQIDAVNKSVPAVNYKIYLLLRYTRSDLQYFINSEFLIRNELFSKHRAKLDKFCQFQFQIFHILGEVCSQSSDSILCDLECIILCVNAISNYARP